MNVDQEFMTWTALRHGTVLNHSSGLSSLDVQAYIIISNGRAGFCHILTGCHRIPSHHLCLYLILVHSPRELWTPVSFQHLNQRCCYLYNNTPIASGSYTQKDSYGWLLTGLYQRMIQLWSMSHCAVPIQHVPCTIHGQHAHYFMYKTWIFCNFEAVFSP